MKILQIGTTDNLGGAAKLSYSLKQELDQRSISNFMAVKDKTETDKNIVEINKKSFFIQKVINKLLHADGLFKQTYKQLHELPYWDEVDIVHLHNIHGNYFNILDLPKITKEKKIIWTLHDPWLLTDKPKLAPEYKNIFRNENIFVKKLKKTVINNSEITIIAPSNWLKNIVEINYPKKSVRVINYGIDTDVFSLKDKITSRKILNLPTERKIILSISNGGKNNIDKGTYFINEIEKKEEFKDAIFISIGDKDHYIKDTETLSLYYSSADLLLNPSLADNSPLTIMESMSCGTPVVAFRTGGIPEIIDHKINGYIAEYKNFSDLLAGVEFVLNHPDKISLQNKARE